LLGFIGVLAKLDYCNTFIYLFIYKLRTQCHTIIAETVQNSNRH